MNGFPASIKTDWAHWIAYFPEPYSRLRHKPRDYLAELNWYLQNHPDPSALSNPLQGQALGLLAARLEKLGEIQYQDAKEKMVFGFGMSIAVFGSALFPAIAPAVALAGVVGGLFQVRSFNESVQVDYQAQLVAERLRLLLSQL